MAKTRSVLIAALLLLTGARPWQWPPNDSDIVVVKNPRPHQKAGGIKFVGKMVLFQGPLRSPLGPGVPVEDSFVVEFPDTTHAHLALIAEGAKLPLKTVRDPILPPTAREGARPLQAHEVAWHAYQYDADTLVMWGYDAGDSQYVGRLQVHTNIPVRPDSHAVIEGYWMSYGQAVPIKKLAAAPIIKKLRRVVPKVVGRPLKPQKW